MKINKKYLSLVLFVLVSTTFLFTACEIKNPTQGLEVRIETIERTTTVSVQFVDAATQQLVQVPVEVVFEGDGKEEIISSTNVEISELTSNQGVAVFAIKDDVVPSEADPFKVNLVCQADGYLSTSQPVSISKTGAASIIIFMTNLTNLPSGTASNTETTGTSSNTTGTSGTIVVSSGEDNTSNSQATITLPQGTILKDQNGNALSGTIKTTVTYFNPTDQEALTAFPGGFSVEVENENGEMQEGGFVSAGFVAVEMTVDGTPVETFENGTLQLDIDIPADVINPETEQPVASGDVIPLWSFNEDTGEWKYEGEVTIAKSGKSKTGLKATYKGIPHLSYWNLDWFLFGNSWCSFGLTIKFESTTGCFENVRAKMFYESVLGSGNFDRSAYVWYNPIVYETDPYRTFEYVPPDKPFLIEVWNTDYSELLGTQILPNLCATDTTVVEFTPTNDNIHPVTLSVRVVCDSQSDNPRVVVVNGIPIYAQKVTENGVPLGSWFYIGNFNSGVLPTICLETNQYYIFQMEYDGEWYNSIDYEPPFLIDQNNILYEVIDDPRICDNL